MIKVKNGKIVRDKLPKTGHLKDGTAISNYDKLPEEVLRREGWIKEDEFKKG